MELKYLNTFKTIVEEGSFTGAAERLHYTQSTVTFQIDQIERELSVKLFERIGRRMVLTAAGRELLPRVNEVLDSVGKLYFVKRDLSECEGELHVGVAETYLCYRLPEAMKRFVSEAPRARLYIESMNCYDIRSGLVDGNLDIGLFYADIGGAMESLVVREVQRFPVGLFASPMTAARFSDFTSPNTEHKIPLIINEPGCIFRQIFEKYLSENSIILDHTIELGSIATIKSLVENDVGVSFLPRFVVEDELRRGTLTELETGVKQDVLTLVCGYHKNKWVSPLMELFLRCVFGEKDHLV